jgi:hypothetical protein
VAQEFDFKTRALFGLLLSALVYLGWQYYRPDVTSGSGTADGSIGILLGLFICSLPARNGIDVLYFERGMLRRAVGGPEGLAWLLLNGTVMLAGWLVIVVGATLLTRMPL